MQLHPPSPQIRTGLEKDESARFAHKMVARARIWNAAGESCTIMYYEQMHHLLAFCCLSRIGCRSGLLDI
jgi:hypothetical protein